SSDVCSSDLMLLQKSCHHQRICLVLPHAYRQGFQPKQREPCIKWPRYAACRILIEFDGLVRLLVAGNERPADGIAMTIDIFGGAMHHNIRAQLQRLLKVGAGKGIIDYHEQVPAMGQFSDSLDIDQSK